VKQCKNPKFAMTKGSLNCQRLDKPEKYAHTPLLTVHININLVSNNSSSINSCSPVEENKHRPKNIVCSLSALQYQATQ